MPAPAVHLRNLVRYLPVGMQIVAPWWAEETLLSLGAAYQRETDWHLLARARGARRVTLDQSTRRSSMRIKYIVPFPFDEVGIANRAAQLPAELRTAGVDPDFVPVKNSSPQRRLRAVRVG